jgi:hypothetical protein
MGCTHCMVSAHGLGQHMERETYRAALEFSKLDGIAMLTGGEPTEHPDCCWFIAEAKRRGLKPALISNGMFLEDRELTARILDSGVTVQITNDARFYPKRIRHVDHPNLLYTYELASLIPLGRARDMIPTRQYPQCFNLRSLARHFGDLAAAILQLRLRGRFCTPTIEHDGTVRSGESNECFPIGTVGSSLDQLTDRLLQHDCNACGLGNNLTPELRAAVGGGKA